MYKVYIDLEHVTLWFSRDFSQVLLLWNMRLCRWIGVTYNSRATRTGPVGPWNLMALLSLEQSINSRPKTKDLMPEPLT